MLLRDIVEQLDRIAPPAEAEQWDNVGLLIGDREQRVSRIMLCIDYTHAVAAEAAAAGCELVVAYHPPLFKPLNRMTSGGASALVFDAIRRGVAIYSPHTAFDVATGGTNDVLAQAAGLGDCAPLRVRVAENVCKLVTFVPYGEVDRVSQAMFDAGAGRIGAYAECSFRTEGVGTFRGDENSNPTIGRPGRREQTAEIRIETVVSPDKIADVVAALRASHSYEEPAFDLQQLAAPPTSRGIGRIGMLDTPCNLAHLVDRLKASLGLSHLLVAGDIAKPCGTVAVCAGAGGELLDDAIAKNADVFITGELRHHDVLRALAAGVAVICTLHSNSERCALPALRDRLLKACPDLAVTLSRADADPFAIR